MSVIERKAERPDAGHNQSRLWRYGPLVLWLAGIFFASTDELSGSKTTLVIEPLLRWFFPHISVQSVEAVHLLVRKAGHLTEYAVLALLAARAFSASRHALLRVHWFLASLVLVSCYALSDEYHQSFVPSRTASIYDSLIDVSGGLLALVLVALWKNRRNRKPNARTVEDHA